jgi:hypothetical protein
LNLSTRRILFLSKHHKSSWTLSAGLLQDTWILFDRYGFGSYFHPPKAKRYLPIDYLSRNITNIHCIGQKRCRCPTSTDFRKYLLGKMEGEDGNEEEFEQAPDWPVEEGEWPGQNFE